MIPAAISAPWASVGTVTLCTATPLARPTSDDAERSDQSAPSRGTQLAAATPWARQPPLGA